MSLSGAMVSTWRGNFPATGAAFSPRGKGGKYLAAERDVRSARRGGVRSRRSALTLLSGGGQAPSGLADLVPRAHALPVYGPAEDRHHRGHQQRERSEHAPRRTVGIARLQHRAEEGRT